MSPPDTEVQPEQPRKRQRAAQVPPKRRPANGVPFKDQESGKYTLLARAYQRGKKLEISLSEPGPNEECSITLDPISDYRLPFLPQEVPSCVMTGEPGLTKASLPCGHSFNAMALLYHFTKNSMTCPICRAGHPHAQMASQSLPFHARKHFTQHLESLHTQEVNDQIAADANLAARILQQEVSRRASGGFMPMTRIVLLLHAYDSMDAGSGQDPTWTWELPLTSSLNLGVLEFESFGYSLAQLNLNLLRLPTRPRGFEAAIGIQSLYYGSMVMFRTVRFPSTGSLHRVVFARDAEPTDPLAIEVITMDGCPDFNVFYRLRWVISVGAFSNMVLLTATRNHVDAEMVAV